MSAWMRRRSFAPSIAAVSGCFIMAAAAQQTNHPHNETSIVRTPEELLLGEDPEPSSVPSVVPEHSGSSGPATDELTDSEAHEAVRRFANSALRPVIAPKSTPTPTDEFRQRKRQLMMNMAAVMMKGSPAMQKQGLLLLFEVQNDEERAANEASGRQQAEAQSQRLHAFIDGTTASDDDKARAKALVGLGARPQEVMDELRLNDAGARERQARADEASKLRLELQAEAFNLGMLDAAADQAIELIENGTMTTGLGGWLASFIPGSAANRLRSHLRAIDGMVHAAHPSLDPVNTSSKVLKNNIRVTVETRRIFRELRSLTPLVAQGDRKAIQRAQELTDKLGKLHTPAGVE
jgi:hypothetical protein